MSQDFTPQDQYTAPPRKQKNNTTMIVVIILVICFGSCCFCGLPALLLPAVQSAREEARKMQCSTNMKQIGISLHNYHDIYGSFPPAYTVDEDGKPLHSWRVRLLPFIDKDCAVLYNQIKLDEPWDSPHNSQFHNQMPSVYSCPSGSSAAHNSLTCYKWVLGPDTISDGPSARTFADFENGTSNSVALVEVIPSTNWMDPREIMEEELDAGVNISKTGGVGSYHKKSYHVLFMDGHVENIKDDDGFNLRERCQIRPPQGENEVKSPGHSE